ncbi:hypothetical protein HDV05_000837 [Chytridiales sp. JEL 0842]|nr:hypothetical protein HDV05_000837 [Chytridiales sp. JEL 0842]
MMTRTGIPVPTASSRSHHQQQAASSEPASRYASVEEMTASLRSNSLQESTPARKHTHAFGHSKRSSLAGSSNVSSPSGSSSLHFVDQKLTPSEIKTLSLRNLFAKQVNAFTEKRLSSPPAKKASTEELEDVLDKDILVCVRARPLLPHEVQRGLYGTVTTDELQKMAYLHNLESKIDGTPLVKSKEFEVDFAFDETVDNEEVYTKAARGLIPLVLGGGVGALFAYGQTGSGKTFTMTAIEELIARDLFDMAREYRLSQDGGSDSSPTGDFEIKVSFFEIFGNHARDLLSPSFHADVSILEDVFGRIQVKGAIEETVTHSEQLLALIERGASQRRTEGTAKNATSSRSHAICRIRIANLRLPEAEEGILYLLDLAGSESAADTRYHDKERIQESVEINKSLATLKDCIRNRAMAASSSKHIHIPYRNSKVTILLKEAFELASSRLTKTVVIAALNPSILDTTQSLSTLRYIAPLKVSPPKNALPPNPDDPAQWSNETLRSWVINIQGSRLKKVLPDVLCPTESGKQLLRLPEAVFIDRCCECEGVTAKYAKDFYLKLWKLLIDARTKVKTEKMRALKMRAKNASKRREIEFDRALSHAK